MELLYVWQGKNKTERIKLEKVSKLLQTHIYNQKEV